MTLRIAIVDDDEDVRHSMRALLQSAGYVADTYDSAQQFLAHFDAATACAIVDIRMPAMGGLELQGILALRVIDLPVILMTGHGDVPLAVQALQAGAVDFIEKPFGSGKILGSIQRALEIGKQSCRQSAKVNDAKRTLSLLTAREQTVLQLLVDGHSNKVAAHELGISPRTLETHRANIMDKMNARNLSDVMRLALAAG